LIVDYFLATQWQRQWGVGALCYAAAEVETNSDIEPGASWLNFWIIQPGACTVENVPLSLLSGLVQVPSIFQCPGSDTVSLTHVSVAEHVLTGLPAQEGQVSVMLTANWFVPSFVNLPTPVMISGSGVLSVEQTCFAVYGTEDNDAPASELELLVALPIPNFRHSRYE
jgi:hypothetical protein